MLRSDRFISLPGSNRLLHIDRAKEIEHRLMDVLQQLHDANPLMTAQDRQKVQSQLDYLGNPAMVSSVVDRLLSIRQLTGDLKRIARADFKPKLTANQRKLKDKIAIQHQKSGFQPPDMESYASQPGGQGNVHDLFDVCVAEGYLVAMSGDVFLHVDVEVELRRILTERMRGGVGLTVAEIRDLLGTTRKYAVPICEYIDRVGLTRRDGDLRFLV